MAEPADPLRVDGARPAVEWVASLPVEWTTNSTQRLVLLALAADSFDGHTASPTTRALAQWCGVLKGALYRAIAALEAPIPGVRPALIEVDRPGPRRRSIYRLNTGVRSPSVPEPEVGDWSHERDHDWSHGRDQSTGPVAGPVAGPAGWTSTGPVAGPVAGPAGGTTPFPLPVTPPPGTAAAIVSDLEKRVPGAATSAPLRKAIDDLAAGGWTRRELQHAIGEQLPPDAGVGLAVRKARDLQGTEPPHASVDRDRARLAADRQRRDEELEGAVPAPSDWRERVGRELGINDTKEHRA